MVRFSPGLAIILNVALGAMMLAGAIFSLRRAEPALAFFALCSAFGAVAALSLVTLTRGVLRRATCVANILAVLALLTCLGVAFSISGGSGAAVFPVVAALAAVHGLTLSRVRS